MDNSLINSESSTVSENNSLDGKTIEQWKMAALEVISIDKLWIIGNRKIGHYLELRTINQ
jgi:hypothetical protein